MGPACLFCTSRLGIAAGWWRCLSRSKRGLSASLYLATSAGITMTADKSMATRQPVVAKVLLMTTMTPLAAMPPNGMPRLAKDIQNALERRSAPNSASSEEVAPNSPLSPIPCTIRKTTRSTGAAMPHLA